MSAHEIAVLSRGPVGGAMAESFAPVGRVKIHESIDALLAAGRVRLLAVDATGDAHEAIDWIREAVRRRLGDEVLALVDRDDAMNAVLALEVGADALLELPSHPRVACAYARRLLRAQLDDADHLRVGPLEMHLTSRSARVNGRDLHLPESEFDLLARLAQRAGEAIGRKELVDPSMTRGRAIDSRICRLRGRLAEVGGPAVVTLRGRGYLLSPNSEAWGQAA